MPLSLDSGELAVSCPELQRNTISVQGYLSNGRIAAAMRPPLRSAYILQLLGICLL